LEAYWLFNTTKIDAVIETKSIIHALINFVDGSTTAHFAKPDMKLPISYAILDKVESNIVEHIDILELKSLEFRKIKTNRYPIWQTKDLLLSNPDLGVVINASNEIAIDRFIKGDIKFSDISKINMTALEKFSDVEVGFLDDIYRIDSIVRDFSKGLK
jgi:1-deoxy-D-xylulose-5-phosphate reductoisomerase